MVKEVDALTDKDGWAITGTVQKPPAANNRNGLIIVTLDSKHHYNIAKGSSCCYLKTNESFGAEKVKLHEAAERLHQCRQ
jgi:hypothetical protein